MSNDHEASAPTTIIDAVRVAVDVANQETLQAELIATGVAIIGGGCIGQTDEFKDFVLDTVCKQLFGPEAGCARTRVQ